MVEQEATMRISGAKQLPAFLLALLCSVSTNLAAADAETVNNFIQGGHSGTWYNIAQPGHGLFIEVLNDSSSPTGKEIVAAWFAYFEGEQIWLLAQGDVIEEGDGFRAYLEASIFDGNDFPPDYDPGETMESAWGTLVLSFTGCDKAHLEWDSELTGYGTGELDLRRLTTIAESQCIPDLGGEEGKDDHGDSWTTATYISLESDTHGIDSWLEEQGDIDVFAFEISASLDVILYTLGPSDTDTVGTLYRIEGNSEVEIAFDDDSSDYNGFLIKKHLTPGTYTIHVKGKKERTTGPYNFYYGGS
jgi:hypothetical protein